MEIGVWCDGNRHGAVVFMCGGRGVVEIVMELGLGFGCCVCVAPMVVFLKWVC